MKATSATKDLDLSQWGVMEESAYFGKSPWPYDIGWAPDEIITSAKLFPKRWKVIPSLHYTTAYLHPSPPYPIDKQSEALRELFFKFFQPELKRFILKLEVRTSQNNSNNSSEIEPYRFLLPEFWITNHIFRRFETIKKEKISPFLINWEVIFSYIWTNYCQLENRPIMPQAEFMNYLFALGQLAEDTISTPVNNMSEKNYEARLHWIISHRHPEDCKECGMSPDRWAKQLPKNRKDCFQWRIDDARDYLNFFFKKFSLATTKNALELFLLEAFEGFANDLVKNRLLIKCGLCGEYFHFREGKKFCSLINEGKDCGKKARFRKYYLKSKHRA